MQWFLRRIFLKTNNKFENTKKRVTKYRFQWRVYRKQDLYVTKILNYLVRKLNKNYIWYF